MTPTILLIILAILLFFCVAILTLVLTRDFDGTFSGLFVGFELLFFIIVFGFFINSKFMCKNNLDYWKNQIHKYEILATESEEADDKKYYLEIKAEHARAKYETYYKKLFEEEDSL